MFIKKIHHTLQYLFKILVDILYGFNGAGDFDDCTEHKPLLLDANNDSYFAGNGYVVSTK